MVTRPALARMSAALLAAAVLSAGRAAAEITVSPLRQVITKEAPIAVYEVSNASDRIIEGRVGWTDLAAVETGYAPAPPETRARLSAAPYLVVSPARFRLEPGRRTRVTVKLKNGVAVPAGERRSHLLVETAPVRTPLRRAGGGLEADVGLGVSTPVILRGGLAAPVVTIKDTKLLRDAKGLLELQTTLSREGKYSAYGRFAAVMKSDGGTATIAEIDNVSLHVDADARRLTLGLGERALPEGTLTLRFVGAAEFEGCVFAEKSFEIAAPE